MEDLEQVRFLRMGVLPPYVSDDDDDSSRSVDEYRRFYEAQTAEVVRASIAQYIKAIELFGAHRTRDLLLSLVNARKEFVMVLPFTGDELEYPVSQAHLDYLEKVYASASGKPQLIDFLLRFQRHVNAVLQSIGEKDELST